MNHRTRSVVWIRRGLHAAACIVVSASLAACDDATAGRGMAGASGDARPAAASPTGARRTDLLDAVAAYESRRYDEAIAMAGRVRRSGSPGLAAEAAYVSGLARLAQGRLGDAERDFEAARGSATPELKGKVDAARAIVFVRQRRDREALSALDRAWPALGPSDRLAAARTAERAANRLADRGAAIRWRERANGAADTVARTPARPAAGSWAVQVGAYRDASRARSAARRAETSVARAGHGPIRVQRSRAGASELWFVQFGAFADRAAAERAIRNNGWSTWIAAQARG